MYSARTALQVDADNVYVIYRRTEAEMPARIEKVHHALVSEGKFGIKSGREFYDYQDKSMEETLRDRDIRLLRLKQFLDEVEEQD